MITFNKPSRLHVRRSCRKIQSDLQFLVKMEFRDRNDDRPAFEEQS